MSLLFSPIEDDFLLKYRPFPENPTNDFLAHWHEIAISVVFYEVLFYFITPVINRLAFGDTYSRMENKKLKTNFDIHTVSMVQSILSILMVCPMFAHKYYTADPIFGKTDFGAMVGSITIGYFIWDLIICLQYFKMFGVGFLIHAAAALYVFSTTYIYCQPLIPAFLIFELSTPFVNINWYASRLPDGVMNGTFVVINGLLLMTTFFSVRIIWGFYAIGKLIVEFWDYRYILQYKFIPLTTISLNFVLDILNIYWFTKMVQIAKKKISGSSSSSSSSASSLSTKKQE